MSVDQQVQQMALQLRVLEAQLNEIASQETALVREVLEHRSAMETIRALPVNRSAEIMVPVGADVFLPISATFKDRLVLSVGAQVATVKTKEEATALLEERTRELEKMVTTRQAQRFDLTSKVSAAREALSRIFQQAQAAQAGRAGSVTQGQGQ